MGMYTYIGDCDVVINDLDNLNKLFNKIKDGDCDYSNIEDVQHLVQQLKVEYNEYRKCNMLDFSGWDGYKIISYWYAHIVELLRDIALFVEGTVYLDFETDDEAGRIEFEEGELIIHTGQMDWQESSPEDLGVKCNMAQWLENIRVSKKI